MSELDGPRVVELEKITRYLLNLHIGMGGANAGFFATAGFDPDDPLSLARALGEHAALRPVIRRETTEFGEKCLVRCELVTPNGRNPCIVAVWFRPHHGATYRLITAYPGSSSS